MVKRTTVQKRVNEGVRVLTALYGTRRVWGIGPRAILDSDEPAWAIFDRLGITYGTLTKDVNAAGLKGVARLANEDPKTGEVNGLALGFYTVDDNIQRLKEVWVTKLREMRAKSIRSAPNRSRRSVAWMSSEDVTLESLFD